MKQCLILTSLFLVGLVVFNSCKKSQQSGNVSEGIRYTDSFVFHSGTRIKSNIKIKDQTGQIISLDEYKQKIKKSTAALGVCGSGTEYDNVYVEYQGYNMTTFQQGSGSNDKVSYISTNWSVTLPEDIEPIASSPESYAQIKVGPFGWTSAPAGDVYRTANITSLVLVGVYNGYKTWQVTTQSVYSDGVDYCNNSLVLSRFQLATNCPNFTVMSEPFNYNNPYEPFQDPYSVNNKWSLPMLELEDQSAGTQRKVKVSLTFPIIAPPQCKGEYYTWTQKMVVQWKKQGPQLFPAVGEISMINNDPLISSDSRTLKFTSNYGASEMAVLKSGPGTYIFRYYGVINALGEWGPFYYATIIIP